MDEQVTGDNVHLQIKLMWLVYNVIDYHFYLTRVLNFRTDCKDYFIKNFYFKV